jgi:23S rRNA (uridine2552-2'-O)-methyltransferase
MTRRQAGEALGGEPDVVLSDMAAPTTGHRRTDHLRTMHLCEVAADFAVSVLKPGGHFLAKTFQGGTEAGLLDLEAQFQIGASRQAAGLAR